MQERNLTELLTGAFKNPSEALKTVKPKMEALSAKNTKDLEQKVLPNYLRTPTADELVEMRQFAIDYKKLHKQASKREIRKATQAKFNIQIFR